MRSDIVYVPAANALAPSSMAERIANLKNLKSMLRAAKIRARRAEDNAITHLSNYFSKAPKGDLVDLMKFERAATKQQLEVGAVTGTENLIAQAEASINGVSING